MATGHHGVPGCILCGAVLTSTRHLQRRTRLLLKNNIPDFQGMPREYDLSSSHDEVDNTFVFTESDLEGFKNKNKMRRDAANQGIPSYLMRPKVEKPAQKDTGPGGRRGRKDAFRQVIPSTSPGLLHELAFSNLCRRENSRCWSSQAGSVHESHRHSRNIIPHVCSCAGSGSTQTGAPYRGSLRNSKQRGASRHIAGP